MKNSEFVTKLKKAIEAAFKKDSFFKIRKIIFHEGDAPVGGIKSENIEVYIRENPECEHGLQWFIKLYVPEYQMSAAIYITETILEKIQRVRVDSKWRADIHENLIITTVTKQG